MSNRIVITGGTGFIGSHLVGFLVEKGYEIIILTRNPRNRGNETPAITFAGWDGQTPDGWLAHAEGARAIINLAGESIMGPGWSKDKKNNIKKSRVLAGKAVLEAVQKAKKKPEVVIQGSATGYYGSRADEELTEKSQAGTGFLPGVAEEWEASTLPVKDMGVRHVIARTSLVLDGHHGFLSMVKLPFMFFMGGHVGNGRQWMPWIQVEDEIAAITWLMENEKAAGIYNLAAPEQVRSRDFFKTLGRVMHRPSWFHLPGFMFKPLPGEMAEELLLSSARVIPSRLEKEGYEFRFPRLENALQYSLSK